MFIIQAYYSISNRLEWFILHFSNIYIQRSAKVEIKYSEYEYKVNEYKAPQMTVSLNAQ
jgi:hypothetical protein